MGSRRTVEDRIRALYRTDPSRFVRERNALAKALRQEGDRDAARRIKAVRKPKKAAWALNVEAAAHADEVAELRSVGQELRRAQDRAVDGGGDRALRAAADRRRALIGRLAEAALRHASGRQRDRLESTLEAASVDDDIGERLEQGRLVTDHDRPSGVVGLADRPVPANPGCRRRERAVDSARRTSRRSNSAVTSCRPLCAWRMSDRPTCMPVTVTTVPLRRPWTFSARSAPARHGG